METANAEVDAADVREENDDVNGAAEDEAEDMPMAMDVDAAAPVGGEDDDATHLGTSSAQDDLGAERDLADTSIDTPLSDTANRPPPPPISAEEPILVPPPIPMPQQDLKGKKSVVPFTSTHNLPVTATSINPSTLPTPPKPTPLPTMKPVKMAIVPDPYLFLQPPLRYLSSLDTSVQRTKLGTAKVVIGPHILGTAVFETWHLVLSESVSHSEDRPMLVDSGVGSSTGSALADSSPPDNMVVFTFEPNSPGPFGSISTLFAPSASLLPLNNPHSISPAPATMSGDTSSKPPNLQKWWSFPLESCKSLETISMAEPYEILVTFKKPSLSVDKTSMLSSPSIYLNLTQAPLLLWATLSERYKQLLTEPSDTTASKAGQMSRLAQRLIKVSKEVHGDAYKDMSCVRSIDDLPALQVTALWGLKGQPPPSSTIPITTGSYPYYSAGAQSTSAGIQPYTVSVPSTSQYQYRPHSSSTTYPYAQHAHPTTTTTSTPSDSPHLIPASLPKSSSKSKPSQNSNHTNQRRPSASQETHHPQHHYTALQNPPSSPLPPSTSAQPIQPPVTPGSASSSANVKQCTNCYTTTTPMWRKGPLGAASLCNACGVKWRQGKMLTGAVANMGKPVVPAGMGQQQVGAKGEKKRDEERNVVGGDAKPSKPKKRPLQAPSASPTLDDHSRMSSTESSSSFEYSTQRPLIGAEMESDGASAPLPMKKKAKVEVDE
ncbi:hypothetical protein HDV05_003944 [Chytridiales sp. JEL 0842]|nr:hypothetical protein HDV05_003944 [Chytridiales sp. JEL 0842]